MLLRISTYFWYKAWQEQLYCKFSKFCIFCFFRDSNSLLLYKLATFMIYKLANLKMCKLAYLLFFAMCMIVFLCNIQNSKLYIMLASILKMFKIVSFSSLLRSVIFASFTKCKLAKYLKKWASFVTYKLVKISKANTR